MLCMQMEAGATVQSHLCRHLRPVDTRRDRRKCSALRTLESSLGEDGNKTLGGMSRLKSHIRGEIHLRNWAMITTLLTRGGRIWENARISYHTALSLLKVFSLPWSGLGLCTYNCSGKPPSESTRYKGNFMTCQTCIPARGSIPAPCLGRQLVARPHFCTDMPRIRGMDPAQTALYRRFYGESAQHHHESEARVQAGANIRTHTWALCLTVDAAYQIRHPKAKITTMSPKSLADLEIWGRVKPEGRV
ncbi:hypothetical protein V8C35DRAFT_14439 [Trichoderma chlorosporum]